MPEIYVMTLGLEEISNLEPQKLDAIKFEEYVQKLRGNLDLNLQFNDVDRSVIVTFNNAERADSVIETFLETCVECNLEGGDYIPFCLLVGLAGGDDNSRNVHIVNAQKLFEALRSEVPSRVRDGQYLTSQVLITKNVFAKLPPKHQDLYGQAEQVSNIEAHRRFPSDALQCFVISPIGPEGSAIRKRADDVFNNYIKPACDGTLYRAVRGDLMTGKEIMPDVNEALQTAPMVVAYLGGSDTKWNPNVMLEVGYRLATGLPIVFLLDSIPDGSEQIELPFDLKDHRSIHLPLSGVGDSASHPHQPTITSIRRMLNEEALGSWQFPHACATIVVDLNVSGKSSGPDRFAEASRELAELFEIRNIAGSKLMPVIKHLLKKMPHSQREPFSSEQNVLIGKLINRNIYPDDSIRNIVATIPIVFQDHRKFPQKAFLPVIGSFARFGDILKLRVLYLDVTDITHKTKEGFYRCRLSAPRSKLK